MKHLGAVSANLENATRVNEFVSLAKYLLQSGATKSGGSGVMGAVRLAEQGRATPTVQTILRSAVASGGLGDAGWAAELAEYRQLSDAFTASLANFGLFDAMLLDGFQRVPLRTRLIVSTSVAVAGV